jgi:hypothetical protein
LNGNTCFIIKTKCKLNFIVICNLAHAPGASRLEHPLQTFSEFGSDKPVSLHVCSLYTVARLDSGALYWWWVHVRGIFNIFIMLYRFGVCIRMPKSKFKGILYGYLLIEGITNFYIWGKLEYWQWTYMSYVQYILWILKNYDHRNIFDPLHSSFIYIPPFY